MLGQRRLPLTIAFALLVAAAISACGESTAGPSRPLYIALGDSLSVGVGASEPDDAGFVPLVYESLDEGFELLNLGHGGDTSRDLSDHGHLDEAIAKIEQLNGDSDADNDVRLVTLEIGGNDLLRLYFSLVLAGTCPDLATALIKSECIQPLASALDGFDANLGPTLDRLQEADPQLRILLLTLYDPFSGLLPAQSEIAQLSLEGMEDSPFPQGLNDIIREHAALQDIPIVDIYPLFENRAADLISGDFIHPNDRGYSVIADAVSAALAELP